MKPLIALTMGDPAGVGPEIVAAAWPEIVAADGCRPFVVGHPEILRAAAALVGTEVDVVTPEAAGITAPDAPQSDWVSKVQPAADCIPCLPSGSDEQLEIRPATIDARGGQAAYDAVVCAARLALSGGIDALVTGPLHKEALRAAGHAYPGHTELLAELCGASEVAMMLYLPPADAAGVERADEGRLAVKGPAGLGVVHVTLHMALAEVFAHITPSAVAAKVRLAHEMMGRLKGAAPRIAVAALNPHAGEGGLFGREETEVILPGVEEARRAGVDVMGPLPVDTLMIRARDGEFDAVVAMYHDQGHIALKLLGMHEAVNVTLGLPVVRTSVAHGTAFDRAWCGEANHRGLLAAVRVAARLAHK